MKLSTKFNLVLFLVLGLGFVITGWVTERILLDNARQEVVERAGMMMEGAGAIRSYTVKEIRPLLKEQMKDTFLPQSVPAYAATTTFDKMRKTHPEYHYKEATLNPTNPRNRAVDWETDVIKYFDDSASAKSLIGERDTATGRSLYLARPIRITNPACLTCHSTADQAPKTQLARYGDDNGFGWRMQEVVGAQIVSVPMEVAINKAKQTFYTFMAALGVVFLLIIIVLNLMLRSIVIQPVTRMAALAEQISTGDIEGTEFNERGKDEISQLGASFNRMRRSLEKAFKMLDDA